MLIKSKKSPHKANKTKSKSPTIKSKSQRNQNQTITKSALKEAYNLVINDLFQTFLKAADGQAIRLDKIGTFTKRPSQMISRLDNQAYRFYKMGFRMSRPLKRALDQQLS